MSSNSNLDKIPKHVAIVMDGNGRWAKKRFLPRAAGHRAGVQAVRRAVKFCGDHDISVLTLYTLSTENFLSRPKLEVNFLTSLFSEMIAKHVDELHAENVRMRFIGDLSVFPEVMLAQIEEAATRTKNNTKLILVFALNYSGRWDITNAVKKLLRMNVNPDALSENDIAKQICLHDLPEPDLCIRTGGEQRISNFMLWQFAYSEFFFTDVLWPDFDEKIFTHAIEDFQKRERRFGLTSEQVTVSEII